MVSAALGLAGAIGVAQPAGAAKAPSADLSVQLTTTAVGTGQAKPLSGEIRNAGPAAATGIVLTIDVFALDSSRVTVSAPGCTTVGTVITCGYPDLRANGNSLLSGAVKLTAVGPVGAAGSVTISVAAEQGDSHPSDNTSTTAISVRGHGADLVIFGEDVRSYRGLGGNLEWQMFNVGDEAAAGMIYTVHLPAHVRFESHDRGCTYSADNRDATCIVPNVVVVPAGSFATNDDAGINLIADVATPGAIALTGGVVTSGAIKSMPVDQQATAPKAAAIAPKFDEVDAGDNTYHFTVFVDAQIVTSRTPSAQPGLPVTGGRTIVYAAAGGVAAVLGFALMLLTRRRRMSDQD